MFNYISHLHFTYSSTRFEDLDNEIIHEIFDYLDAYHIYQSFFKLNARFQNLLLQINVPIKASISTIPKSAIENYYTDFLRPIQRRMKILHLSDPFIIESIFPTTENVSIYSQLKTLHLENIISQYLQDLLHRLTVLPNLSSLTIHISSDANMINMLNRLFQLPVLKYCEIFCKGNFQLGALPMSITASSPLEQLIINNCSGLKSIEALLSYVPQLRRLSISGENVRIFISILFNNSKQYSFALTYLLTYDLQEFMKKHSREIKLVHICTMYKLYNDNMEIEENFMAFHLPPVKITLSQDKRQIFSDHTYEIYTSIIPHHHGFLGNIQQWFFTHESMSEENLHEILCSFASHR